MKLKEGTKVKDNSSKALFFNRLAIADSTYLSQDEKCLAPCFFPKEPFRLLTQQEYVAVQANSLLNFNDVSIVSFNQYLFDPLIKFGLHEIRNKKDLANLKTHPLYEEVMCYIDQVVAPYCINKNNFKRLGLSFNDPNLYTTTRHAETNLALGMHLDYWDKVSQIKISRNRLCINVGMEDRYFLFVNQGMTRIKSLLTSKNITFDDQNDARVKFFSNFSDYPVLRIKIKPFEAYIAPTEEIIHDGSSVGQRYGDLSITYLGYFNGHTQK